ncbi:MAG: hypothetical protein LBR85_04945 [Oscillospiraceae bacterium]|jgi:hypothetical protein|nr:hypothetical protein [Oscillospiraceae bacterium]
MKPQKTGATIKKATIIIGRVILYTLVVLCLLCITMIIYQNYYLSKDGLSTYDDFTSIRAQFPALNEKADELVYLPDEYESLGRHVINEDSQTLEFIDDRMVNRAFFQYAGSIFYVYVAPWNKRQFYTRTYSDIYSAESNEKAMCLNTNPQGLFVLENYLYYVYGKHQYNILILTLEGWITINTKDTKFARLDLDTGANEDLSRAEYEAAAERSQTPA